MENDKITFSFGENWLRYIGQLDKAGYDEAKKSLCELVGSDTLAGKSFLDLGCGSGIFSLAAVELRASRVVSVDVDPKSVEACLSIKTRCNVEHWGISQGSALDANLLEALGRFDVVYAWGVLHHTGDMWGAIDNAAKLVAPKGLLIMAIYNRTRSSRFWLWFKRLYNRSGRFMKSLLVWSIVTPRVIVRLLRLKHPLRDRRGMSVYYDAVDWAGGLPYEYASFDDVCSFMAERGFPLKSARRTRSIGCNEFVFQKAQ
jgi:2-polyprenyl-6-hydroxyphenyl methylase/3-demethylubiquinone-9 3-methyltransferase